MKNLLKNNLFKNFFLLIITTFCIEIFLSINIICLHLFAALMLLLLALPSFAAYGDEIVARVSFVSYLKNSFSTGHSWLYIENLTDRTLTVGVYELEPGEVVSQIHP